MYSEAPVELTARTCIACFSEAGLTVSATVRDSAKTIDLALELGRRPAVVRCVLRAAKTDLDALRLMLAQGDFERAALVYTADDQPHLSGEIETYPLPSR